MESKTRTAVYLAICFVSWNLLVSRAADPTTQPLLHQSDLTYVGAFRLPGGNFGSPSGTFEYAGGFVSGNVYNDPQKGQTLFIPGYLSAGYVSNTVSIAQVSIPSPLKDPNSVGLNGLAAATVLQGFGDPSNGIGSQALTGNGTGTLIVYGAKLIGTENVAYDASCSQTKSAWVASTNFSQLAGASGPYAFNSPVGPRWMGGGYMALVPPEWQALLGGKVVSGNGPWSNISCGSPGPSLHVIDADALIRQPPASTKIASIPLVYYAENNTQATLGHWNSNDPNQIVNGKKIPSLVVTDPHGRGTFAIAYEDNAMKVMGALFADGTRSVLFFGSKGLGPYCYGEGTANSSLNNQPVPGTGGQVRYCYDRDRVGAKGDHSYPYTEFVWAYDVNDLLAAKNGKKKPWEVVPYSGWAFKVFGDGDGGNPPGVSWDPAARLAYLVVPRAGGGNAVPLVHVFHVD